MTDTAMTLKLTEPQRALLAETPPGVVMKRGPVRASLIRRGLVFRMDTPAHVATAGTLTLSGEAIHLQVLMERQPTKPKPMVREPERRVHAGDVVRIHRGVKLFRVIKVTPEPAEMAQALLVSLEPEDRDAVARWEAEDLLHVVPPVAHVRTLPIGRSAVETLADEPVAVAGPGWLAPLGVVRQVATVRSSAMRLPYAVLLPWPEESRVEWAAGCLRIGDSIVVDGRLFRVTWDGGQGEPILSPENWHGFQGSVINAPKATEGGDA